MLTAFARPCLRVGALSRKSCLSGALTSSVPAQVLAAQRMLEAKYNEAARGADDWGRRAELAVRSNNDDLAREALRRKKAFAVRPASMSPVCCDRSGISALPCERAARQTLYIRLLISRL